MSDTPKPPRSRKSRAEVKTEFLNLNEIQKLSPKERVEKAQQAAAIRSSIVDVSVEKATQLLASAGVSVQKSLSAVSEELLARTKQLADIKQNIELEQEELTRLYGVGIIEQHLDVLRAQHDEERQGQNDSMEMIRAEWQEETARFHKEESARREALIQERVRENEAYIYDLAQKRKQSNDSFAETLRLKLLEESIRREAFEKSWKEREDALFLREKELSTLREQVAAFPAQLDAEVKKQVAIVSNSLSREHKHETELVHKDISAKVTLFLSEKNALEGTVTRLSQLNTELQAALAVANQKNVEIATKALEVSAGKEALSAVQKYAQDTSNNGGARKS